MPTLPSLSSLLEEYKNLEEEETRLKEVSARRKQLADVLAELAGREGYKVDSNKRILLSGSHKFSATAVRKMLLASNAVELLEESLPEEDFLKIVDTVHAVNQERLVHYLNTLPSRESRRLYRLLYKPSEYYRVKYSSNE